MAGGAIATRYNLMLTAAHAAVGLYAYLGAPLLIAQQPLWALTLLPAVLATQPGWALLHEAIHGLLHPARRINDGLGRLLGVLFGAPFGVLRTGHLLHHRFNRSALDASELYDPARTPRWRAQLLYYFRLLIGLYLAELGAALLAWLPRALLARLLRRATRHMPTAARAWARRRLLRGPALAALRIDGLAVLLLIAVSAALYGEHWAWLAALLAARGLVISLLDNVFHYGTAPDAPRDALNLSLPRPLARACLHFHLHGIHHRYPALPWTELPRAFAAAGARYDGTLLSGVRRQFAGVRARPG